MASPTVAGYIIPMCKFFNRFMAVVCIAGVLTPGPVSAFSLPQVQPAGLCQTEALTGASLWMKHAFMVSIGGRVRCDIRDRWRDWLETHEVILWTPAWAGEWRESARWGIPLLRRRWRPSPVVFAEDHASSGSTGLPLPDLPKHEVLLPHQEAAWIGQYVVPEIEGHAVAAAQSGKPLTIIIPGLLEGDDAAAQYEAFKQWFAGLRVRGTAEAALQDPQFDDKLAAYFQTHVLEPLLIGARTIATTYQTGLDYLIPIMQYGKRNSLSIVFPPISFPVWRLQMRIHAERLQVMATTDEEAAYLERMHQLMDLEEHIVRAEQTAIANERRQLENKGNYVLQITIDSRDYRSADKQLDAYGPWIDVLRRRLAGRPMTHSDEELRLLQAIPFGYFAAFLRQQHPDWPPTTREALAGRLARRWTKDQVRVLRRAGSYGIGHLRDWLYIHGTPQERIQLGLDGLSEDDRVVAREDLKSAASPFSREITLHAPRTVHIHYQNALYDLLRRTNPEALLRIEQILSHPFSDLVKGVDYDLLSGARSLIIVLDTPLEIGGQRLGAVKLKGVIYDPERIQQPFNIATLTYRLTGNDPGTDKPYTFDIDPSGVHAPKPNPFVPIGGGRARGMENEAAVSHGAFMRGFSIGIPIGWAEFPDIQLPDGEQAGAVLLGQPHLVDVRATDFLNRSVRSLARDAMMYDDILRLFSRIGRQGALFAEAGFAHTNLHLGNVGLVDDLVFIHDTDGAVRAAHATPEQYFGSLVIVLRNILSSAWRLGSHSILGSLAQKLAWAMLDGFFNGINPADLEYFTSLEFNRLLLGSMQQQLPLWKVDHRIVHTLWERFGVSYREGRLTFRSLPAERFLSAAG